MLYESDVISSVCEYLRVYQKGQILILDLETTKGDEEKRQCQ